MNEMGAWNVLTVRRLDWKSCWFPMTYWPWWLAFDVDLVSPFLGRADDLSESLS